MEATKPGPATSRWKLRLLGTLGVLLALVWASPIIVGYTPLVGWATAQAEAHIDGKISVGGVSLGWFSPIVLYDVVVRDAGNQVVAHVPRIDGDRMLIKLLLDRNDLGSFRLEKAKIDVTFQGNSSNLERLFVKTLNDSSPAKDAARRTLPQIHVETADATLMIHDADAKTSWRVHALTMSGRVVENGQSIFVNVSGSLHDGSESGSLKAEINLQNVLEPTKQAAVKGKFTSLPVGLANVVVRRYQPGVEVSGSLQGNFTLAAGHKLGKPYFDAVGEVIGNRLTLRAPQLDDVLRVERVTAPWSLRLEDGKLHADRLELHSDFGKATLHGSLDLERSLLDGVDQPGFELVLDVNLATVAERLPKTLRLHRDMRMTSGQLHVKCKSVAMDGAVVWQGKLDATDVRGVKGKQTIAWSDPITLEFQARDVNRGIPVVDFVKCNARFLHVTGSRSADQFTLTAEADLHQMAEPLGQFIDLDAIKLGGKANGTIVARRFARDQFVVQGHASFKQINLTWLTKHAWQEDSVAVNFLARGLTDRAGRQRIGQADIDVTLGADRATLKWIEPIADFANGPWGNVAVRADGDLARWHTRALSWTTLLDDWQLAGAASVHLQCKASAHAIECSNVSIQANNLRVTGKNLWINEPTLSLQTDARFDANTGNVELDNTKITCPTVRLEAAKLSLETKSMALRGGASVAGDVARLRQWTHNPAAQPGEPLAGQLVARFDFETTGDRVTSTVNGSIRNFTYGPAAASIWREAEIRCAGTGSYDLAKDSLHLDKLQLLSSILNADINGNIANLTATTDVELAGTLTYDLEKLEPQLRPLLGKDVKIVGKDTRAFRVTGPLYPKSKSNAIAVSLSGQSLSQEHALRFSELKGEAGLQWKSMKAHGCDVGPAEVRAILQQGWFQLYPIETTLNQGKLRLQPNVKLEPAAMEMVLLSGPVIDKAQITPAMCAGAMAYALPVLANVAEAEGAVSVSLEGGRIPLSAPATGEMKGTFTLHSAKVGPSPIVRELSDLLKVPPPTSLIKECKVPFHMTAGKVHHRDLELVFPDFTLKSSGAVGLDGSLALVIEMPIPSRLAVAAKLTSAQAKQMLRIPVGGTLDQPRLDPRALESLTAILGRSILENQLNKLLPIPR